MFNMISGNFKDSFQRTVFGGSMDSEADCLQSISKHWKLIEY